MAGQHSHKVVRTFFIIFGSLFVLIGFIGIFLPLLPTTPFLILAAICYERGSDKFHNWLLQHKYFGPPIVDWQTRKVIRTRYKMIAASMMLITAMFIYTNPAIPIIGKVSYTLAMAITLSYIFTRKSS